MNRHLEREASAFKLRLGPHPGILPGAPSLVRLYRLLVGSTQPDLGSKLIDCEIPKSPLETLHYRPPTFDSKTTGRSVGDMRDVGLWIHSHRRVHG